MGSSGRQVLLPAQLVPYRAALNQVNTGGTSRSPVTPIPGMGAKAGISYSAANGLIASLFDVYAGRTDGYSAALNPKPQVWLPDWGGGTGDTIPVRRGRTILFGLEVWIKSD